MRSGATEWAAQDPEIGMATRDGEALQTDVIPRLEWGTGVQKTVTLREFRTEAPWEGCASPNPRRTVCEEPSAAERRVCHLRPHLCIAAVVHSDDDLHQAEVTIEHIGPALWCARPACSMDGSSNIPM